MDYCEYFIEILIEADEKMAKYKAYIILTISVTNTAVLRIFNKNDVFL